MASKDLVVRIAGESGEGVISTGDLLAQAAARAGYELLTFKTYPAEIKGGHALIQLRLGEQPLFTQGDEVDILLAFNREAFDKNIGDLKRGGLLIFDSADFTPPESTDRRQYAVPLTEIARTQLKFELGKNVVGVGVVGALFGLSRDQLTKLLREKFARKGEDIVSKNVAALDAGIRYVQEHLGDSRFAVQPGAIRSDVIVVSGNQALAMGAIAGGCQHYFGYPITPATDIMEFLAVELPKVGGTVVQAEDEISAAGMVLGASYGGARAMSATSGPGLSLMVEMLGLGSMAELPAVIVDVQRAGPSTGMPTKHEQGDLHLAVSGGHGDVGRIVLAPTSVGDCFFQAINAFSLAEQYQVPVILLSDTVLATRTERIPRPELSRVELKPRLLYQPNGHSDGSEKARFMRYAYTPSGVSPMSIPGQAGGQYVATGLEHSELGRPRYDPVSHTRMTEKRFRKLDVAAQDAPPAERVGDPTAEIGIVTWGSTMGTVIEAVEAAREKGIPVEAIAPKMLWPLPDHQLAEFIRGKRVVIVPEVNYTGQFADLLAARYGRPFVKLGRYGGVPFRVAEIVKAIEEVSQHVG